MFVIATHTVVKPQSAPKTGWINTVFQDKTSLFQYIVDGHPIGNKLKDDNSVSEYRVFALDTFGKSLLQCQNNDLLSKSFAWVNIGPQQFRHFFILEEALPTAKAAKAVVDALERYLVLFKAKVPTVGFWLTAKDAFVGGNQNLLTADDLELIGTWNDWVDEPMAQEAPQQKARFAGQVKDNAWFAFLKLSKCVDLMDDNVLKKLCLFGSSAFGWEQTKQTLEFAGGFSEIGDGGLSEWANRSALFFGYSYIRPLVEAANADEDTKTSWTIAFRRWDDLRKCGVLPDVPPHETISVKDRFLMSSYEKITSPLLPFTEPKVRNHDEKSIFSLANSEFPYNEHQAVMVIRSPMHTAKSVLIRHFRAQHKKLKFMHVSPRISLCAKDTRQLNAVPYRDIVKVGKDADKNTLTIVLNSMTVQRVMDFSPDVLVLDEVVQILEDVFQSDTMSLHERAEVQRALCYAMGRVSIVIASDADATQRVLSMLKALAPNVKQSCFYVENTYKVERGEKIELPSRDHMLWQIKRSVQQAMADQKTVQVYCSSKNEAEAIERVIRNENPQTRRLLVTADTSGEDEVSQYLADPDSTMSQYDVVVASPTITSGISIESENVGDVFLVGMAGSIGVRHMRQQTCRARKAKRLYWYVETTNMMPYRSEIGIYQDLVSGLDTVQSELLCTLGQSVGLKKLFGQMFAATRYDVIQDHTNMRDLFNYMSFLDGWRLGEADVMPDKNDLDNAKEEKKEAKRQVKAEKQQAIVDADDLTEEEYKKLSKKERLTRPQANALQKAQLHRFYCQAVDLPLVEMDDDGRFRTAVLLAESIKRTQEETTVIWAASLVNNEELPAYDSPEAKKALYEELTKTIGFDLIEGSIPKYSASEDWVAALGERVVNDADFRQALKQHFGVVFRGIENAVNVVNAVLRAFGLNPNTKNGDREQVEGMTRGRRLYTCDNSALKSVLAIRAKNCKGLPLYHLVEEEQFQQFISKRDFKYDVKQQIKSWRQENLARMKECYKKNPSQGDKIVFNFEDENENNCGVAY